MQHLGTIRLNGWKQIVAACVLLICIVAGYSAVVQSGLQERLPVILNERIKSDLEQEIARRTLPIDQGTRPTREQGERYLNERKAIDQLRILSVEKRGFGTSIVAKVRFAMGPESEETRYYRVKHNWLTRWHVWSAVTERAWQTGWL